MLVVLFGLVVGVVFGVVFGVVVGVVVVLGYRGGCRGGRRAYARSCRHWQYTVARNGACCVAQLGGNPLCASAASDILFDLFRRLIGATMLHYRKQYNGRHVLIIENVMNSSDRQQVGTIDLYFYYYAQQYTYLPV